MPNLGPTELLIILLIVIAIFGAGKLASLGGALGKGVRDFRAAIKEGEKEEDKEEKEEKEEAKAEEKSPKVAEEEKEKEPAKEA